MNWELWLLGVGVLVTAYMGIGTEVVMHYSRRLTENCGRTMTIPPTVRVKIMLLWPIALWNSELIAHFYLADIKKREARGERFDPKQRPSDSNRTRD